MTAIRSVVAVAALAGLAAVVWVLGAPGWIIPPAVALVGLVVGLGLVATRSSGPARRVDAALTGVAVVALAGAIAVAVLVPRPVGRDDDGALRERTAAVVTDYLTVAPGAGAAEAVAARLRALTPMLTDTALADLRSQGPDAALPGAVATSATQQAAVQAVGVAAVDGDTARVLVYGALRVSIPGVAPDGSVASIARWAVMRRVDGTWRLADLHPVGAGG
ncbi:hypothetical protein [uncultured Williamsia sp.]|uniref:hypothetical protein n=1 Tax=uncultured Williamsia sp. TaxID=259311 RepID=UPI002601CD79|nr:hypothetical protein [uncultured Williamsia sp.]